MSSPAVLAATEAPASAMQIDAEERNKDAMKPKFSKATPKELSVSNPDTYTTQTWYTCSPTSWNLCNSKDILWWCPYARFHLEIRSSSTL